MFKQYRKRPVVIDAVELTQDNIEALDFKGIGAIKGVKLPKSEWVLDIQTLEGEMRAQYGDYIIIGVEGEVYPCKPSIFNKTYERVEGVDPFN